MSMLVGIVFAALPILLTVALLVVAGWRDRRRHAEIARQIRLTDAIHHRLGAVAAPVVTKPVGRPWQVRVAAPLERPDIVEPLLAVIRREFADGERRGAAPFEIVLVPREKPAPRPSRPAATAARPKESVSWT